jgi:hypothetical protein
MGIFGYQINSVGFFDAVTKFHAAQGSNDLQELQKAQLGMQYHSYFLKLQTDALGDYFKTEIKQMERTFDTFRSAMTPKA